MPFPMRAMPMTTSSTAIIGDVVGCEPRVRRLQPRLHSGTEHVLPRPTNGLRGVSCGGVSEEPLDDVWLSLATVQVGAHLIDQLAQGSAADGGRPRWPSRHG